MKTALQFDFTVNKENNTIVINREFDANLDLIWEAWTNPEILDQWWAPKPYKAATKSLDFKVGGKWLYAMVSPQNENHWCKAEYKTIEANKLITWLDAFCDENGVENASKPRSFWTLIFSENNGVTTVNVTLQQDSFSDIEMMIQMGFKDGFTMALQNLDQYIESKK